MWLLLTALLALSVPEGTPPHLYKILTPEAWQRCQNKDRLSLGPDDTTFIHLAEQDQVPRIAKKFFPDQPQLMIVELDPKRLPGRLVKEANPGGTIRYYHLYDGYLPFSAVSNHQVLQQ